MRKHVTHSNVILGLDSSGITGGVSLLSDDGVIGTCDFTSKALSSQRLLPSIDWLLNKTSVELKDLKAIAFSNGPGSFTGLRIGLSIAKTLAWQLSIPAIGVDTLEMIAFNYCASCHCGCEKFNVLSLIDANQGKVYYAFFEASYVNGQAVLNRLTESAVTTLDKLPMKQHSSRPCFIATTSDRLLHNKVSALYQDLILPCDPVILFPSSVITCLMGRKLLQDSTSDMIHNLDSQNFIRCGYIKH